MDLTKFGWRKISTTLFGEYKNIQYWTHDDHQPNRHGFFTATEAIEHQGKLNKGYKCNCIPKEFKLREDG